MRLAEHPDFAAFLAAAATESELPEAFVEKDYWITEILRTIATTLGERAIFKGGTSPEVTAMLASDEYDEIKADYDEKSRIFFPRSYRPPPDLRFTTSDALFPPDDLRVAIEPGYEEECRRLFFRPHP